MIASAISRPFTSDLTHAGLPPVPNILFVACDDSMMHRFAACLEDVYHLFSAMSDRQVLRLLEAHAIDLVIVNLPGRHPHQALLTCSLLKSSALFAHLPLILLIPEGNPDWIIRVLDAGADAYIAKPLIREYLRAQIRNVLANRSRIKDHFHRTLPFEDNPSPAENTNETFLHRLNTHISENLADRDFNVDRLAQLMNMSRPTLYRRVKCISEMTPNEWINLLRLEKAAQLLTIGNTRILTVVRMVGFNSRSNFGKAFTKHFGVTPKEYRQLTDPAKRTKGTAK